MTSLKSDIEELNGLMDRINERIAALADELGEADTMAELPEPIMVEGERVRLGWMRANEKRRGFVCRAPSETCWSWLLDARREVRIGALPHLHKVADAVRAEVTRLLEAARASLGPEAQSDCTAHAAPVPGCVACADGGGATHSDGD